MSLELESKSIEGTEMSNKALKEITELISNLHGMKEQIKEPDLVKELNLSLKIAYQILDKLRAV